MDRVVKSYRLFGLSFYERIKLSEERIQFNFEPLHCEDIGLYIIGKYPRFKFGNGMSSEEFKWEWYAVETIRLTFLNLINKNVIELVKVQYSTNFLFNYFKVPKTDFYFRVTDLLRDDDWLTDLLYTIICEVNKDKKHPLLFDYIHAFLDEIMHKHGMYSKPSRAFIIEVLKKNAKNHSWIKITKEKKFLGVLVNNNLDVSEMYIPRLNMQHNALELLYFNLFRSNGDFAQFSRYLEVEIEGDFKRRVKSN